MAVPIQGLQVLLEVGDLIMRADTATGEQVLEWQGCHCREPGGLNQREATTPPGPKVPTPQGVSLGVTQDAASSAEP